MLFRKLQLSSFINSTKKFQVNQNGFDNIQHSPLNVRKSWNKRVQTVFQINIFCFRKEINKTTTKPTNTYTHQTLKSHAKWHTIGERREESWKNLIYIKFIWSGEETNLSLRLNFTFFVEMGDRNRKKINMSQKEGEGPEGKYSNGT